ncbi:6-phosphogluconate phosphatase [Defluviimonas aquaemixtae]|uniref:6-phosphogluconate phosphatase n=1 Tax=Albidovulum aquaemixtae TaxID=1542388 RepID=A0A2R8B253_9RHOB|nr:HAD-IA family hydrolase [Defluviimonas aquaemixtae]SPH16719.1 6-phosphogluconate phosphatase [Defluviimonas aquaemixtae]
MRPAAVLFDCDGVLVDSEPMTDVVVSANLARYGLDIPAERAGALFIGGTMASVGETARSMGATLPENWLDEVYDEIFARLAEGTPLIPGVATLLDVLDGAAIPYAVGSNGPHRKMEITLGQHPEVHARLRGRIFSRHDVARPKPAPDLYLHAAAHLGAASSECVVIEDSPTGARAARAAGMACFGYAPNGGGARLEREGARVFRRMDDLPALLGL